MPFSSLGCSHLDARGEQNDLLNISAMAAQHVFLHGCGSGIGFAVLVTGWIGARKKAS